LRKVALEEHISKAEYVVEQANHSKILMEGERGDARA
jgi:3-deoxy-D-arabino-heptulosonate 7-phosphate (DAHP) synthase